MPGNADANEGQTLAAAAEHLTRTGVMQTECTSLQGPRPGGLFFELTATYLE